MSILRSRTVWKREPAPRKYEFVNRLTSEQQTHVRAALEVLKIRYGCLKTVARLMRLNPDSVWRAAKKSGRLTPGMAIRVAALAKVPVDDVLDGRFPAPGCCPYCGRS